VPLLRIGSDYHPIGVAPAIYKKNSTQYAVFTTGGYADSNSTLWRGDNETTVPTQMAFAVSTGYTGGTINETNTTYVPFKINFGAGEGGFAQATVVGNEIFLTTDTQNVNGFDYGTSSSPTGHVYRMDISGTTPTAESTLVVANGGGSLFNNGTAMMNLSGKYAERLSSDATSTTGTAVDPLTTSQKAFLALWLRTE
jgi:hypothetical protein